jgi:2-aminoadipate transaminase
MDYQALFANRASKPAPALFRAGAAIPPGVIPLTYGFPDPGSFPIEALVEAATRVLREQGKDALQYGPIQGPEAFRRLLAAKLQGEGVQADPENILVTVGGSQGIDLVGHLFVNPGDVVLVEAPTFIGALQTFRNLEADVHEVPLDENGMDTDALAERLDGLAAEGRRPKLIYTIPTFQNPSGTTLSEPRRRQLIDLARRHGVVILEDDAYGELRFSGQALPSLYARAPEEGVVQVRTFSKILAAGLRLGYVVAPKALMPRLLQLKVDVGTSPFVVSLAQAFASAGEGSREPLEPLQRHIETLQGVYRARRDAMLNALEEYAPPGVEWTRPDGGFFTWVTLPEGADAGALLSKATEAGVSYIPGAQNFPKTDGRRHLRLSFSFLEPDQLTEGIRRLGRVLHDAL